jgi:histone acetyltransferase (RNA polymerase elongator complex component)
MWRYGVRTVELGVQSMDRGVLEKSRRGYGPGAVRAAVAALRDKGFGVGVQLMPGLPGDSRKTFLSTIEDVVKMRPDMVRLYPTLVLRRTALERLFHRGVYRPLELREAVGLCAQACLRLEETGIPVIRMGLQASSSLQEEGVIVAGPWHPAFGFLVRSEIYHGRLARLLHGASRAGTVRVRVHPRDIPLVRGYKNQGIEDLAGRTGADRVELKTDEGLEPLHPVVEWTSGDGRTHLRGDRGFHKNA